MKRLLMAAGLGLLSGLLCLGWGWRQWTGPGPGATGNETAVRIRIPSGMTLAAAADTLAARGLLRDRRVLLAGARLTGRDRELRAGLYELAYGQSPRDLLNDLTTGLSVQVVVTIPEGLDSQETAAVVAVALGLAEDRFLVVADSLARLAARRDTLLGSVEAWASHDSLLAAESAASGIRTFHWSEGLLAPDTYHFAEGSEAAVVAEVLLATQLNRLQQAVAAGRSGVNGGLTPLELLTLASLVEAEALRDEERGLIAAVYTNRLGKKWRLEADPTVAFVLGKKGQRLYFRDLKVDSRYNTYRFKGLPSGPIGAPGLASLQAAAQPDPACEAMYFVSDGAGGHVFSRTAREHEAAVARYRESRARQRRAGAR